MGKATSFSAEHIQRDHSCGAAHRRLPLPIYPHVLAFTAPVLRALESHFGVIYNKRSVMQYCRMAFCVQWKACLQGVCGKLLKRMIHLYALKSSWAQRVAILGYGRECFRMATKMDLSLQGALIQFAAMKMFIVNYLPRQCDPLPRLCGIQKYSCYLGMRAFQ